MVRRDTFLPSSSHSVLLFSRSACLLKYAEEEVLSLLLPLSGPPCSFLSDALFLLLFCCAACVGSPPSLHLPSLCWSLALWPAEWFAPQLPAVTICPFNVWSADAHSPPSFPFSLSLSLAVFLLALIISSPSSFFSQAKGDKLHLLVSMRSHVEKRLKQQVVSLNRLTLNPGSCSEKIQNKE